MHAVPSLVLAPQRGASRRRYRVTRARSLAAYARDGRDDEATRVLCAAIARLHGHAKPRPPSLIPLEEWFAELEPAARQHGGVLARSAATACELLAHPQDIVALHGDIHHGNVLDFGARGWLAIDPKGLIGERGFDYANIFCNPDLVTATVPSCFARRVDVMVEVAGLDRVRLLQWVLAWAGLFRRLVPQRSRSPGARFQDRRAGR